MFYLQVTKYVRQLNILYYLPPDCAKVLIEEAKSLSEGKAHQYDK